MSQWGEEGKRAPILGCQEAYLQAEVSDMRQACVRRPRCPQSTTLSSRQRRKGRRRGFTLIELMVTVALLATLAALVIPVYQNYLNKAATVRTIAEVRMLDSEIKEHEDSHGELPDTLAELGRRGNLLDYWGNPYEYMKITCEGPGKGQGKGKGKCNAPQGARKDKFLVPLNSDYDLYSKGADGDSKAPLTARASWDDIIRANDGSYVGLASEF